MPLLTEWRLKVYSRAIVAIYLVSYVVYNFGGCLSGQGLVDLAGQPIGADFLPYWIASSLAASGQPAAAYDLSILHAWEQQVAAAAIPLQPWIYPPTYLLVLLPLSLLPYLAALWLWLGVTLGGYLAVLWRIAPRPETLWLALAFPGTFQNLIHGQNGFLITALLGGGLLLLEGSPFLAGGLLGLLSFKPHLGLLIPVALAAGRHWRAFLGAAVSTAGLALASLGVFGVGAWKAFGGNLHLAGKMIHTGSAPWYKMPTVFMGTLLAGGGYPAAWLLQGLATLGAVVAVAWVWKRPAPLPLKAAVLGLAIPLAIPYAFEYDLALLALPLAWLGWDGYQHGWRRYQGGFLFLVWLLPAAGPFIARAVRVQVAPLILGAFLLLVLLPAAGKESKAHD